MTAFEIASWRTALGGLLTFLITVVAPIIGGGILVVGGAALICHSWREYYGPGARPRLPVSIKHFIGGASLVFIGGTIIWMAIWGCWR